MSIKWKRDDIEKFIMCVQQNPCVYNVKSNEYLDRTKKAQAFNQILIEMQEAIAEISLDEIKKKWKNLRTQYMHELRMVSQSKKSGSGRADLYVPKLWCFDQLSFLNTHVQIRESKDNTETPSTSSGISHNFESDKENSSSSFIVNQNNSFSEESSSSFCEKPPRKRKNVGEINGFRKDLDCFKNLLAQRKKQRKFEWLGTLVATQMDDIDPEDQADASWQVQCLMRDLTNKSVRKQTTSTSSSTPAKDILELSMDGVFDESDFEAL